MKAVYSAVVRTQTCVKTTAAGVISASTLRSTSGSSGAVFRLPSSAMYLLYLEFIPNAATHITAMQTSLCLKNQVRHLNLSSLTRELLIYYI